MLFSSPQETGSLFQCLSFQFAFSSECELSMPNYFFFSFCLQLLTSQLHSIVGITKALNFASEFFFLGICSPKLFFSELRLLQKPQCLTWKTCTLSSFTSFNNTLALALLGLQETAASLAVMRCASHRRPAGNYRKCYKC